MLHPRLRITFRMLHSRLRITFRLLFINIIRSSTPYNTTPPTPLVTPAKPRGRDRDLSRGGWLA